MYVVRPGCLSNLSAFEVLKKFSCVSSQLNILPSALQFTLQMISSNLFACPPAIYLI